MLRSSGLGFRLLLRVECLRKRVALGPSRSFGETEAANEAKKLVEKEGRKAVLMPSDLQDARHCGKVIKKTVVDDLCGID